MSSKTRTRSTRRTNASTTGSARTLRSVPEPTTEPTDITKARTDTEDKLLWAALHANSYCTATGLAVAAKIGKSTVAKILAKWEKDGSVTRTAGIAQGGRRIADLWSITETDAAPVDTPEATDTTTMPAATEGKSADHETAEDQAATSEPTPHAAPEPPAKDEAVSDTGAQDKAPRLAPGALRGLVEDYLREHPGEEFSPSKLGKELERSSGAVNNALEKLVADGYAVQTQASPKRFARKPAS